VCSLEAIAEGADQDSHSTLPHVAIFAKISSSAAQQSSADCNLGEDAVYLSQPVTTDVPKRSGCQRNQMIFQHFDAWRSSFSAFPQLLQV